MIKDCKSHKMIPKLTQTRGLGDNKRECIRNHILSEQAKIEQYRSFEMPHTSTVKFPLAMIYLDQKEI